ncbi:MAG: LysE family transporter [Verrucomicrobia bacterium]|nr:LysE family transporter [Verrucomicrobiota bacterium]
MSGIVELAVFAGVLALGQFSPGPDLLLLTRTALAQGSRAGAWTAAGIACGLVVHAAVAMSGASLLLAGASLLARCLRAAAAVYLGWIAIQLLRAAGRPGLATEAGAAAPGTGDAMFFWRRGFFCNVFNPKVALFLAAVGAPFLTPGHPAWWPLVLAGVVVGEGFVLWIAWAWALQWPPLNRGYRSASRWIDALFGVALAVLAGRLCAGLW